MFGKTTVGWIRVSWNHQGGVNSVMRLMKTKIWLLPVSEHLVRGELKKGTVAFACTSVWEITASPAFALKPDNLSPLYMSLGPFVLLPRAGAQSH